MTENRTGPVAARPLVLHLCGLWVCAIITLFVAGWLVPIAAFLHAPMLLLPSVLLLGSLSYLVAAATPTASPLTAKIGHRALWAAAVTVLSHVGALFVAALLTEIGHPLPSVVTFGLLSLPGPLAGAAFVGRWQARAAALVLTVAIVVGGLSVPGVLGTWTRFSMLIFVKGGE